MTSLDQGLVDGRATTGAHDAGGPPGVHRGSYRQRFLTELKVVVLATCGAMLLFAAGSLLYRSVPVFLTAARAVSLGEKLDVAANLVGLTVGLGLVLNVIANVAGIRGKGWATAQIGFMALLVVARELERFFDGVEGTIVTAARNLQPLGAFVVALGALGCAALLAPALAGAVRHLWWPETED